MIHWTIDHSQRESKNKQSLTLMCNESKDRTCYFFDTKSETFLQGSEKTWSVLNQVFWKIKETFSNFNFFSLTKIQNTFFVIYPSLKFFLFASLLRHIMINHSERFGAETWNSNWYLRNLTALNQEIFVRNFRIIDDTSRHITQSSWSISVFIVFEGKFLSSMLEPAYFNVATKLHQFGKEFGLITFLKS